MHIYKIYFTIEINCNGVISYTKAHISIMANSKEEAVKIVKENTSFNYGKTDKVEELILYYG